MFEILLTRIFSVTMWYHFAFVAISIAMFGMTLGGLHVYQNPARYTAASAQRQMARSALWFAITAVLSALAHFFVPFASQRAFAVLWIMLTFALLSVPFYYSGVCVCIALTKFPTRVSGLYAADLIGAASGCILLIYTLQFTDAPTAVIVVALLGSLAAVLFATEGNIASFKRSAIILCVVYAAIIIGNSILVQKQQSLLRVTWVKGSAESRPLYEKWNSFSRVAVDGDPNIPVGVNSEGISKAYPTDKKIPQLSLRIDADAQTTLTSFNGNLEDLDYLKYDIKNLVHTVRTNGSILIIGAGGGRDVLSALLFGQKSVRAVEINRNILNTVNGKFGDFTGHIDRDPRVTFVNDEARSYIARTDERFDVIEASFIDTWAATAAGALTLTENSLYTVDAWNLFLKRLTPSGVLSFSRWYVPEIPAEAYRLTSLAAESLRESGITDTRSHILLLRNMRLRNTINGSSGPGSIGAATILVGKLPFTPAELDKVEALAKQMQFDVVLSPRFALDQNFASLAAGDDPSKISSELHLNISPPTDNNPFFFYMTPFRDSFSLDSLGKPGGIVGALLLIVSGLILLSIIYILLPMFRKMPSGTLATSLPHMMFFAAIGLGFMLIEISQMQRLIVFLGHPTYALSVVLFALLLSSGLGSQTTRGISGTHSSGLIRLLLLLVALIIFGLLTPYAITMFSSATAPVRISVAAGILFPLGFFMGMAFPLGLKLASGQLDTLTPGLWGINGATSIFGSILAVMIAMNWGIASSFWTGFACYAVAFTAYFWATRQSQPAATP